MNGSKLAAGMKAHGSRRGAAVVAMVLAMVLSALVLVGAVMAGARDQDLTVHRLTAQRGFYAAEAGMNMAIREVMANVDFDGNGVIGGVTSTASSHTMLAGAAHDVAATSSAGTISLRSLGQLGQSRKAVHTTLAATAPAYAYGAAITTRIDMENSGRIDAFDSSTGTYVPSINSASPATIASNVTSSSNVLMKNYATIVGDVYIGVGGNPNTVIKLEDSASVSGIKTNLTEAITSPAVTAPSPLPSSLGNVTYSGSGTTNLGPGVVRYGTLVIQNSRTVVINGDTTIYCNSDFELKSAAKIVLNPGATLRMYANKYVVADNGTSLNMPSGSARPDPSRVTIYQSGTNTITLQNASTVVAVIVAPNAQVLLQDQTRLFGVIQAKSLIVKNEARFTQDLALTGGSGGGGGSGTVIKTWTQVAP